MVLTHNPIVDELHAPAAEAAHPNDAQDHPDTPAPVTEMSDDSDSAQFGPPGLSKKATRDRERLRNHNAKKKAEKAAAKTTKAAGMNTVPPADGATAEVEVEVSIGDWFLSMTDKNFRLRRDQSLGRPTLSPPSRRR